MKPDWPESSPWEEGRAIVERQGGTWSEQGGLCRCPAHDDHHPSLSVRPGKRRLLLHCFAGCTAADVLSALHADGLLRRDSSGVRAPILRETKAQLGAIARRLWDESRPLSGTPAEQYLERRGIHVTTPELRFHPRVPHGRAPLARLRPALVAAVRDDTGLIAIQRIFLDDDVPRKCSLGRLGRGAVRLGEPAAVLGLAEGVETALSVKQLFGVPCWATLGTERFGRVSLPSVVTDLVLFLDNDAGGQRAEALAREAFNCRIRIEVRAPTQVGSDWNDVLRAGGVTPPAPF